MEVWILEVFFFPSNFSDNLGREEEKKFKFFFSFFSSLDFRRFKNMCKLRQKLRNAKTGIGPTFTWSNDAWFSSVWSFPLHLSPSSYFPPGWSTDQSILRLSGFDRGPVSPIHPLLDDNNKIMSVLSNSKLVSSSSSIPSFLPST